MLLIKAGGGVMANTVVENFFSRVAVKLLLLIVGNPQAFIDTMESKAL